VTSAENRKAVAQAQNNNLWIKRKVKAALWFVKPKKSNLNGKAWDPHGREQVHYMMQYYVERGKESGGKERGLVGSGSHGDATHTDLKRPPWQAIGKSGGLAPLWGVVVDWGWTLDKRPFRDRPEK